MTDSRQPGEPMQGVNASGDSRTSAVARRYLTITELSVSTTLSVGTLRRLYKLGQVVGYQPGGPRTRIVFPPDAIEQAVRAMSGTPTPPTGTPSESTRPPQRGPRPKWLDAS
jgi:hypothetical protein